MDFPSVNNPPWRNWLARLTVTVMWLIRRLKVRAFPGEESCFFAVSTGMMDDAPLLVIGWLNKCAYVVSF